MDGTWRVDQSSTLPAENGVYTYPSITGSVILSEFFKPNWLRFWKLRANYAEVGGTADPYQLANYYTSAGTFSGAKGGVALYDPISTRANANLKPQRSKEFEVGTEISLFRDRLYFDVACYQTKTLDQIISLPISSGTGFVNAFVNAGRIDNSGIEVQMSLTPIKTPDFRWTIDANWSRNRNKVVELFGDSQNYQLASYAGGVSLNARVGESWGTLVGTDFVYDANGNRIVDTYQVNGDPTIYAKYRKVPSQVLGNAMPDWIGGVRNTISYKGFSLSFLVDARKGGDIFSTDMLYGLSTGIYAETAQGNIRDTGIILPGVLPDRTPNTHIAADPYYEGAVGGYGIYPQKQFIYDGSYVKLREVSIGYSLPKSLLRNTFINDLKISIVGRNLWIIHKNLPHADPEAMVGGGNRAYGWSVGSTPTTRDIGVNVTLKF